MKNSIIQICAFDFIEIVRLKLNPKYYRSGYKSGQGHRIDRRTVVGITHKYKLKTRYARLR